MLTESEDSISALRHYVSTRCQHKSPRKLFMPSHPLFNDQIISLSATLAATIGLEEAILLTTLNDAARLQRHATARLSHHTLRAQLPFWDDVTLRKVLQSLLDKGLLSLSSPMFPEGEGLLYSFTDSGLSQTPDQISGQASAPNSKPTASQPAAMNPTVNGAGSLGVTPSSTAANGVNRPMPSQWQPSNEALQRLDQHGIPRAFCFAHLDAFVLAGQEQGGNRNDWNTRFFRHIKKQWVFTNNDANRSRLQNNERSAFNPVADEAQPIRNGWHPSDDAKQILQRAGIDPQFIDDAVPEFILYWSERGDVHKTWNSKFIQHVRQQWARYTAAVEHSPLPTRITDDWQPSPDCYDILDMGHIPRDFATALVAEFVLYWRDANQVHNSWNSRFLQYAKQQWGKRLAQPGGEVNGQQTSAQPSYATAEASLQRLKDTSW
ncbi:MAG: DnaT-like ssDNA-binding domain-containing protein [Oleibacter sp.]|nr:DnaT-like ssDNA-binding domain-containing protein [Thalassolituus sp.]